MHTQTSSNTLYTSSLYSPTRIKSLYLCSRKRSFKIIKISTEDMWKGTGTRYFTCVRTFVTYKFYKICIKSISEFKVKTITMYFLYSANVFHIQYRYYILYMYIYNLSNLTQVSADRLLLKKNNLHTLFLIYKLYSWFLYELYVLAVSLSKPSFSLPFLFIGFHKITWNCFQPKTRQIILPSDNGKISSFNTQWFFFFRSLSFHISL